MLAIAPDGAHARFQEEFTALEDWEQAMLIAALERVASMLGNEDKDAAAILDSTAVIASSEPAGA